MNEEELQGSPDFRHSPDFRSVTLKGNYYTLTSLEAQVVQILYEQYLNGTPDVGKDYILEELGAKSKNMRDVFQSCKGWQNLIKKGERKGTYRLNI